MFDNDAISRPFLQETFAELLQRATRLETVLPDGRQLETYDLAILEKDRDTAREQRLNTVAQVIAAEQELGMVAGALAATWTVDIGGHGRSSAGRLRLYGEPASG